MVDEIENMEIDMNVEETSQEDEGLSLEDFEGSGFLKNPEVGETISFVVEKIVSNPITKGKNKETGEEFNIGLKKKDGEEKRYDIHTDKGVYTINSWGVFFKLLANDGLLVKYAKEHNKSFKGAKVSITRNYNGLYASNSISCKMISAEMGITLEEAQKVKDEVKKAMKEGTLYTVTVE